MDLIQSKFTLDGLVLDMDLSLSLPSVNRGRVGNQSLVDVHGTVFGRPAGAFIRINDDSALIEEGLITQFPFTVAGWFKTSGNLVQTMIWCGDKDLGNRFFRTATNDGDIVLRFRSTTDISVAHAASLQDDNWHHVAVTVYVDGGVVKADVCVDGVFAETLTATGVPITFWSIVNEDRTAIGRSTDSSSDGTFDGLLNNWHVYDGLKATPADALRLYNGYALDSPTAIWRFSEGTGVTIFDTSGNSKNLTATGMGWDLGANGGDLNLTAAGRPLNGVSDYVEVPDAASLRFGTGDFQIHAWVKASSIQADPSPLVLISKGGIAVGEWQLGVDNLGNIDFDADEEIAARTIGTDYRDDLWHLFSVLRHGNDVSILVDAVEEATDSASHDLDSGKVIQIGISAADTFFTGEINRVWIGRATKTIAQGTLDTIALYNRTKPPFNRLHGLSNTSGDPLTNEDANKLVTL